MVAADQFLMGRYMFIGVACTVWPSFFFVDPHGFLTYGSKELQPYLILGIGLVFIVFQYTRSLAFQTSQDTSVVNLLCKTPEAFERIVFPTGSCFRSDRVSDRIVFATSQRWHVLQTASWSSPSCGG